MLRGHFVAVLVSTALSLSHLMQDHWLPLVAEQEKDVLEWTACVNGNRLVLCYMQDVKACVNV